MKVRAPFSALSNGTNAHPRRNIHKRSFIEKSVIMAAPKSNKENAASGGKRVSFAVPEGSNKHTPSKPALPKRSKSRSVPKALKSSDESFLPKTISPTKSTFPLSKNPFVLAHSGDDDDSVATTVFPSFGEERLEISVETATAKLVTSEEETETCDSNSCSTLASTTKEAATGIIFSATSAAVVRPAGEEERRFATVLDCEGRPHRFCPVTKQPAWLFDYWLSREAKNLYATFEGEKAREGLVRHIKALETFTENNWAEYSRDTTSTLSEDSMYEILETKVSYVLKSLYIANNELQNCASFSKCCEESTRYMADEDIDCVHDAATVGRWFADFRKDHKFTLADSNAISTSIWERSSVYKLFAAEAGESTKEALDRHIASLEQFSSDTWMTYCDKGKVKYLKHSAQGVVTTKVGYVLAALCIAKRELQYCQSFIACCREVVVHNAYVEDLNPIDDPKLVYRWFVEFRVNHKFRAPMHSIPYWESRGAAELFGASESEDIKEQVAGHIDNLQRFQYDWQDLLVDGHDIDLSNTEKVALCSKVVYVVHAFANALKHMPRLGWTGCCVLAVENVAPRDGFNKVASADVVKEYVGEYLSNGGKFDLITKPVESAEPVTSADWI